MKASTILRKSLILALPLLPTVALAAVETIEQGMWPATWPKELEGFRTQARTIHIATGLQQVIYEIRFEDRADFERAWPALLKLKTPGAPLTLYPTNSPSPKAWGSLLRNDRPAVRIYAPTEGYAGGPSKTPDAAEKFTRDDYEALFKEGKLLKAGPPWPADLVSSNGTLPEFVALKEVNGQRRWAAAERNNTRGFLYRARVELDLVFDGQVIDSAQLDLPREPEQPPPLPQP